jgi:hypothetical protein
MEVLRGRPWLATAALKWTFAKELTEVVFFSIELVLITLFKF